MKQVGLNVRKLLPSLALGIAITMLAAAFNHVVYEHRLQVMVVGNPLYSRDEDSGHGGGSIVRLLAGIINLSDDFITDLMYSIRGPGKYISTEDRIAVVAIDEDSILRRGGWPWSRRDVADLLAKLHKAKVVGIDIVFPDSDQTSPVNYIDTIQRLYDVDLDSRTIDPLILDNDLYLSNQLAKSCTVLGTLAFDGPAVHNQPNHPIANYSLSVTTPDGRTVDPADVLLKRGDQVITNLAVLRSTYSQPDGEGFINLFPAPNGLVRSIPLFAHVSDWAFVQSSGSSRRIIPSLPLEVMRVALGGDGYHLRLRGDRITIPEFMDELSHGDRYTVMDVTISAGSEEVLRIPLNELAELGIGYRNPSYDYHVYPAWEVLEGLHDGAFDDQLVLLGSTIDGVGYIVSSNAPDPEISIVEAHASLLSSMLKGDFMDSGYQDDYSWQQATIICSGVAVTAGIIFGNLGIGMAISALALLFVTIGNYHFFFQRGMDVGITLPLLSILAVLTAQLIANYLVVGRERRFIRKAFQLNVSPSILGYLESHPDRLSSLQGEHRHMTVLFTDIRGFTTISERMTAPDLARFLNEYFTPMSDIVMQNMGTVDKFIGDGLMAFWNAPADNPRHARDAAKSSLDMLEKLSELQAGWTSRGLPRVSIGCGINTGPMFAGYMGSEQRKNYTVMGDNVNIASRLEGLNKYYSANILITETTKNELGNDFTCRMVDKVRVSGKADTVMIYELLHQGQPSEEEAEELAAFARVFELYQMREFAAAETLLNELMFIRVIPLYEMYSNRMAIYRALSPPPDWDGTFSIMNK